MMRGVLATAVLALGIVPTVLGHSWITQMRTLDKNGKYVGEYGYPRNFIATSDPGYNGELSMVFLNPPLAQQPPFINFDNTLCHPNQTKPVQSSSNKYPRLQAHPGAWMSLRYAENGHVSNPSPLNGHVPGTLDLGRRPNGGTVFVFGTTEPKEDERIANVIQWTKDGKGGDKRGVLLASNDYDDGRCYQVNESPVTKERMAQTKNYAMGQLDGPGNFELLCETNVQMPKDAAVGKPYTLYWVWQWGMDPKANPTFPKGKDEYYTTCMDVDVVDTIKLDTNAKFALAQQDAMDKAVSNFKSRTALIQDPLKAEVGDLFKSDPSQSGAVPSLKPTKTAGAPFKNTTSTALQVPTLTKRPGDKPTVLPGDDDVLTITVTERVTVTAPAVTSLITARPEHLSRHNGAKFRGRLFTTVIA
ncbi:hypothetical protein K505DRAFT_67837 [Melanomma pulvis-pyrius CBS 109.77]|uniref:DUF7492 domain-containing protein n=1 Tax=Melanomma pulvis-pyrius CBS 109.77 TaxID=1314802 RepID=A0A6A6X4L4_9PLEO|nr:hypothetical protein K505DRAFT_67837 [Melanomma pulvis-pyrius CBS 109.77]